MRMEVAMISNLTSSSKMRSSLQREIVVFAKERRDDTSVSMILSALLFAIASISQVW